MAIGIVLAGGNGSRMNSKVAKQYIMLGGKEILYYCLNTFEKNRDVTDVILVTRAGDIEFCQQNIVNKYGFKKVRNIIAGGKQRYDSVYNGLLAVNDITGDRENEIVIIHDGARPFVTDKMIFESINEVKKTGACTVGVPVKDTIKIVDENMLGVSTPDRSSLFQIQTPQTFSYQLIMEAYQTLYGMGKHAGVNKDEAYENEHGTEECKNVYTGEPYMGECIAKEYGNVHRIETHKGEYIAKEYEGAHKAELHKDIHIEENINITDDTMLLEQCLGVKSKVIFGAYENIKITTPEDVSMAEIIVKKLL